MFKWMLAIILMFAMSLPARADIIVAYTADWCPQCQRDKPELKKLEKQGHTLRYVDCSQDAPDHIKQLPTYDVYNNEGKFKDRTFSISGILAIIKVVKILKTVKFVLNVLPI